MKQDEDQIEVGKIEEMAGLDGKRVIEVGCGDGRITSRLAEKAKMYVAMDPDFRSIAHARSQIDTALFMAGSGQTLAFADASIDVVLFTLSLHHQDSRQALEEAYRVLQPDGRVVILEPVIGGEVQGYFDIFRDESEALEKSLAAIEASDFLLIQHDVFYTEWIFDNREELCRYCFDYHNRSIEESIVRQIDEKLGPKKRDQPIVLKEKLNIFSMAKEQRRR